MALLVRSPINWLWLLILFAACHSAPMPELQVINSSQVELKSKGGLFYLNGKRFSGTAFQYFPNSLDTAFIQHFLRGREEGEWRQYYPDGQLKERRYFTQGEKIGDHIGYWVNGRKSFHYQLENDLYEGNNRAWNKAGLLIMNKHYQNGQEEGTQQVWYDEGKIKSNYIMRQGRRFGLLGTKNCINVADSIFVD